MKGPRLLQCSHCGAPVAFRATFCFYCRAALHWGEAPALERGARLYSEHYPASPLLGSNVKLERTRFENRADGTLVHVATDGATWAVTKRARRDVCVALTGVALDPDTGFGALARAYTDGGIVGSYVAMVVPSYRAVRLARLIEGGPLSVLSPLSDWESLDAVAPLGQKNQIELRAADSMLQVLVNGVRVISLLDAGIGFGAFGWRAISLGAPGRVLFQSLEAFEVSDTLATAPAHPG